jgi:hypothetical protein
VYETVYGNITFAVTTVQDVGDMYFHIEGPAENSWVGFGVGSQMDASLIWVVYRSGNGKGKYFLSMDHLRAPRIVDGLAAGSARRSHSHYDDG